MFCFCGLKAAHFLWFFALCFVTSGHEKGSEIKVVVLEGSDAILPCSLNTKKSVVQGLFDWMKKAPNKQEVFMYDGGLHYNNGLPGQHEHFRGRVSHFPQELQFGNASIIIRNTMVADSGVYTCVFPRLQPTEQIFNIRLVVELVMRDRVCEILGAAPKPLVHVLKITEDEALLKCEVRGAFPKPKVEWRDSDGNILPAEEQVSHTGERYNITLLTTVTRTNSSIFHCVATQEEISHETEDKVYVPYCENLFKGTSGQVITGWLVGCFIGMLSFALVLPVLVATRTISIHSNRGCLGSANKSSEDPPAPDSETGPEELKGLNKVVCSPAVSHCSLANYRKTFCCCQLVRKSKC